MKRNSALGSRKHVDHEHREQKALFEWVNASVKKHPDLLEMYAVPNGGKRHVSVARKLKAEGVRAGRPDINLDVARCGYHGARIELKVPAAPGRAKGVLSANQIDCLKRSAGNNYLSFAAWGWKPIQEIVQLYLEGELTLGQLDRSDVRLF